MDRLILGDNQFFGVNHMSEEKGMASAIRFQDYNEIIKVLDIAYDCGIRDFTFSTHEGVRFLCDHFRANPQRYSDIKLYPALPYAHKYANLVNEKGVMGAISDTVFSDNTAGGVAGVFVKGAAFMINRNPKEIMKLLIDAEMKMFRGLNVEVIFLQNIVTDLLLGLGWKDVFRDFVEYIEKSYKVRAGFITLNLPRLVEFLLGCGIEDPIVCSAINKTGYQMNPDIGSYEAALGDDRRFRAFAMSIMAAGAVPPEEAVEYVSRFKKVQSILFGGSTKSHIEQMVHLFQKYS